MGYDSGMNVFIVPGFGMPTDFENDPTYLSYLNKVVADIINFKTTHQEKIARIRLRAGIILAFFSG